MGLQGLCPALRTTARHPRHRLGWMEFHNTKKPHSVSENSTPTDAYETAMLLLSAIAHLTLCPFHRNTKTC